MKKLFLHALAGLGLGLGVAPLALAETTEIPCPGCEFEDPDVTCFGTSGAGCNSQLDLMIQGIDGDCILQGNDCVEALPCLVDFRVRYQSCCVSVLEITDPGGVPLYPPVPLGPSCGTWTTVIDEDLIDWPCGLKLDLKVKLTDSGGGTITCLGRIHCTDCFGAGGVGGGGGGD